jgi:hypothetical protein
MVCKFKSRIAALLFVCSHGSSHDSKGIDLGVLCPCVWLGDPFTWVWIRMVVPDIHHLLQ